MNDFRDPNYEINFLSTVVLNHALKGNEAIFIKAGSERYKADLCRFVICDLVTLILRSKELQITQMG